MISTCFPSFYRRADPKNFCTKQQNLYFNPLCFRTVSFQGNLSCMENGNMCIETYIIAYRAKSGLSVRWICADKILDQCDLYISNMCFAVHKCEEFFLLFNKVLYHLTWMNPLFLMCHSGMRHRLFVAVIFPRYLLRNNFVSIMLILLCNFRPMTDAVSLPTVWVMWAYCVLFRLVKTSLYTLSHAKT